MIKTVQNLVEINNVDFFIFPTNLKFIIKGIQTSVHFTVFSVDFQQARI